MSVTIIFYEKHTEENERKDRIMFGQFMIINVAAKHVVLPIMETDRSPISYGTLLVGLCTP
jgi:hypothetical protein